MTVVEKAAYLKGLTEGLGVDPETKEGKLWGALCDLVSDMAHEIEDLQDTSMGFADTVDDLGDELGYLEELILDLDDPDEKPDRNDCDGNCYSCGACDDWDGGFPDDDDEDDDEEAEYDGVIYDVVCPKCGKEITFDEETLKNGSIECPECGEKLEFDIDELDGKSSDDNDEMPF
jgi:DNA-directed RNA polymerase subunit RPC12/RpoP